MNFWQSGLRSQIQGLIQSLIQDLIRDLIRGLCYCWMRTGWKVVLTSLLLLGCSGGWSATNCTWANCTWANYAWASHLTGLDQIINSRSNLDQAYLMRWNLTPNPIEPSIFISQNTDRLNADLKPADPAIDQRNLDSNQSLEIDNISTEKISQFIQAYLQVLSLIEQRETELRSVELESESQQIEREIEAQAIELIRTTGLTLQEYLQILSLTNLDPEFGERVAAQLQEAVN